MAEYIERELALKVLRGNAIAKYPASFSFGLFAAAEEVSKLSAADVAPVVHGRWTLNNDGSGTCQCCGRKQKDVWDMDNWQNFCGHCGADMRERKGGED